MRIKLKQLFCRHKHTFYLIIKGGRITVCEDCNDIVHLLIDDTLTPDTPEQLVYKMPTGPSAIFYKPSNINNI